jgi:hypothetical protein
MSGLAWKQRGVTTPRLAEALITHMEIFSSRWDSHYLFGGKKDERSSLLLIESILEITLEAFPKRSVIISKNGRGNGIYCGRVKAGAIEKGVEKSETR